MGDHEPIVRSLLDAPASLVSYPQRLGSSASVKYYNERMNAEKSTDRAVFLD